MKKLLLGAVIALLPLTGFSATILGIQAGAGSWKQDPSGSFAATAADVSASADLKNGLKLSEESDSYIYFLVEHPVPLIPNLKYVNTKLSSAGSGTANAAFTFNGQAFNTVNPLTTSLKIDQVDTILYYEILDNDLVSFDFGINAKAVDISASVDDGINPIQNASLSATIPMLYAAAEISLPAGFALAAEISTISIDDDSITDTTAKIMYTTDFNLGIEAGVRTLSIDVNEDSVIADIEFSGIFAGVYFKF